MNSKKLDADLRKVLRRYGVTPSYGRIKISRNYKEFPEFKNMFYTVYWDCEFHQKKK
jgi:hypothetical protein